MKSMVRKKPEQKADLELQGGGAPMSGPIHKADSHKRANDLDGRDWTKYSISIWSDIAWTKEEKALKHPAKFPVHLAERLIRCFTRASETRILDPFLGSGTTLVGAKNLNRRGIGFDVYEDFVNLARERLRQGGLFNGDDTEAEIHQADARRIPDILEADSVDFCLTSPPYWNILTEKRSADGKAIRNYGDADNDLGTIGDYEGFLTELMHVFAGVRRVLKNGKYMVVNVMDLRKKDIFFPYHIDLSRRIVAAGFTLDDIIIWDRRKDYNNLRALGYPYTFRVNKAHEFLLIFQKRP